MTETFSPNLTITQRSLELFTRLSGDVADSVAALLYGYSFKKVTEEIGNCRKLLMHVFTPGLFLEGILSAIENASQSFAPITNLPFFTKYSTSH